MGPPLRVRYVEHDPSVQETFVGQTNDYDNLNQHAVMQLESETRYTWSWILKVVMMTRRKS